MLTRAGCHLCDQAIAEIRDFLSARPVDAEPIELLMVDIESDDDLHRRFLERIPVIQVEGETVCEFVFDPGAFDAAIARRSQGRG